MRPASATFPDLLGRRWLNNCVRMALAIGCICVTRVVASVMVVLGVACSSCVGGMMINVKARAVLPYDNNAHPRILVRVFWSTVVLPIVDVVPYRKVRIVQVRDGDNGFAASSRPDARFARPVADGVRDALGGLLDQRPPLRLHAVGGGRERKRRDELAAVVAHARGDAAHADLGLLVVGGPPRSE